MHNRLSIRVFCLLIALSLLHIAAQPISRHDRRIKRLSARQPELRLESHTYHLYEATTEESWSKSAIVVLPSLTYADSDFEWPGHDDKYTSKRAYRHIDSLPQDEADDENEDKKEQGEIENRRRKREVFQWEHRPKQHSAPSLTATTLTSRPRSTSGPITKNVQHIIQHDHRKYINAINVRLAIPPHLSSQRRSESMRSPKEKIVGRGGLLQWEEYSIRREHIGGDYSCGTWWNQLIIGTFVLGLFIVVGRLSLGVGLGSNQGEKDEQDESVLKSVGGD